MHGCRHGAGLVQSKILLAHPYARLRVSAIWVNKLFGDAQPLGRRRAHRPQVVHLWDAEDVSGGWLADNVAGNQGGDWDTYLLFGPDASWTSQPGPLVSSGSPVNHQIDELRQAMNPLLGSS